MARTKRSTDAGSGAACSTRLPDSNRQAGTVTGRTPSKQPRGPDGRFQTVHGAYSLQARWREGRLDRKTRRLLSRLRFDFCVAKGYASWASAPVPLRMAIDNAILQWLMQQRLFSRYWEGSVPPKRFDTISENLRRELADIGFATAPAPSGSDLLAVLRGAPSKERP